jgi:Pyruvate/2-oxoacid:ferredoxin oxidoreductase gamma subunit
LLYKISDLSGADPEWGDVEREVLLTGIGGQGVQLAAQVLAEAALAEGRDVQLFGAYGGMMRGGNTEATLVVSDASIEAPPTAGSAWAALVMHHDFAEPVLARVRNGGLVLVNSSVWDGSIDLGRFELVPVPATDTAVEVGSVLTAAMVMLGAFATLTGVVTLGALGEAVDECVPPYRRQHVEANKVALTAGAGTVDKGTFEAWAAPASSAVAP